MNNEMAYLLGMILGNGEIQQGSSETTITIDIPHKNLYTEDRREIQVYVLASLVDIRSFIEPLIGYQLDVTQDRRSTKLSFRKGNNEYLIREILRFISGGRRHQTMRMHSTLFDITDDEKKSLLRGIADCTGYIRKSNIAYGATGEHRVYIEIPANWYMVIDIANMLKSIDVPIHNIDFGHPNCRDSNLKKYNAGQHNYWKKEHQIKIYANEFMPIGFNIRHKQNALVRFTEELLTVSSISPERTHKYYWERNIISRNKPIHPGEQDEYLPQEIRGRHFNSWTELANLLGYGE